MTEAEESLWPSYLAVRGGDPPRPAEIEARNALWEFHLGLVGGIVRRMRRALRCRAERESMESHGQMGLLKALQTWEPGRGVPFRGFAAQRIRWAVMDGLRSDDFLTLHHRRKAKASGHGPEQISLDRIMEDIRQTGHHSPHPLGFHDAHAPDPAQAAELSSAWERLPEENRVLLILRFRGMSLARVARLYGLSEGRISQIHQQALALARADAFRRMARKHRQEK